MVGVRAAAVVAEAAVGSAVIHLDPSAWVRPVNGRLLRFSILLGIVLSLGVSAAMTAHVITLGSVEGGWVYPYVRSADLAIVAVWLIYSLGSVATLMTPWRVAEHRPWRTIVSWIVVATALQWILRTMAPYPLEAQFASDNANSFHSVAADYDAADLLTRHGRVRLNAPLHVQSNMPGKLLLTAGLHKATARADLWPWLVIGISNLGALLMFGFVRDLLDSRRVALYAAVLYLFFPARTFFMPLMNTVTPLAVIACGWLLLGWLRTGRTLYAAVLGFALYLLTFFEPLPLVMGLLFLALAVAAMGRRQISWERFVAQAAVTIAVFIATAEAMTAWTGFDIVRTFHTLGRHAIDFNATTARPYALWIAANLWEFTVGVGFCQLIASVGVLLALLSDPGRWRDRLSAPMAATCIGLFAVLGAVDLVGVNRGEVTRLWIFLGCFYQIPLAWACSLRDSQLAIAAVLGVTALHAAVGTTLVGFVVP
jgi:hypothetical protein